MSLASYSALPHNEAMTSIPCPITSPASAIASIAEPSIAAVAGSRRQQVFHVDGLRLRVLAARLWGAGSETPSSQALDSVDVPSFHR